MSSLVLIVIAALAGQPGSANFQIVRQAIDGGGLSITASADYSSSLSLGRADANRRSSSLSYSLTSGVWSPIFVPPAQTDFLFADGFEQ